MVAKAKPTSEQFISLRIPASLLDKLDQIAQEQDRPRGYIVRKAIESYIRQNKATHTVSKA